VSDYLRSVSVYPRLVDIGNGVREWRVMLEVDGEHGAARFALRPTEAKDLQQKLFALALEISEREA
jgi:hypothetical protein